MSGMLQGKSENTPKGPNSLPATDEELLLRYREDRDQAASTLLVKRYHSEIYSYLRRRLGNDALATDAVQTTFIQVFSKVHLFDAEKKFKPWLYAIALNQAIDAQRRSKRHRMVSLDQPGRRKDEGDSASLAELSPSDEREPSDVMDMSEQRRHVRQAVSRLPEAQRNVIELIYYQGMKYQETAEILDVPIGTVKSRCNAAITKLTEAFGRMELFRK
ncbi:MAG: sigma-70 family RNA polymerase sigma factor [Pirellulales bacterium]|nr:sigma-70 family RNA polymerase sigma factor [Pirellulales bacterium]